MFPDYLGKIALIQPETDMEGAHSDLPAWAAWSADPTVGWLMSGSWHQDVPALKETYEGELTEYAETLLRTWTVLTFYWGSAALWPKCKFKTKRNGAEGNCDEPLLFHSGSNHSRTCCEIVSKQGVKQPCDGRAEWACHKHYHQAVCQRCLGKLQDILGGAGPVAAKQPPTGASTDIYNAVVSREEARSVGTVFHLTQVASRKPPFVPPNWRTSYRLQPSALVAVVKLSVSNEPLRRDHTLHWAEVVQSVPPSKPGSGGGRGGPPVHESRIRQEGKMAVRLLGRGDIATFSNSDADLPLSTQVAVIDLRVFVPEVISVLSTFANPQFAEHLKMIPFARRLIGAEESLPLLRMPVGRATIEEYTQDAIFGSEIRCLQMLPDERKQSVFSEIVRLPPVRNLYGTQLEAFANGLRSALHCTQGPPGTGKVTTIET